MGSLLIATCVLCLLMTATLLLLRRGRSNLQPGDPLWLESFSLEMYKPMERLLLAADYDFLSTQPGFEPAIARRLRRERHRIYRKYLHTLTEDFGRLHRLAAQLVISSPEDRAEFTTLLTKLKLNFYLAMIQVRLQLLLHRIGMGTVPTLPLLDAARALAATAALMRQSAVGAA
jgi:hypothetical protein